MQKNDCLELRNCPFCGGKVSIVLCDDEGKLLKHGTRETKIMMKVHFGNMAS